jgi:uncharacterized CHY-type Zn-finger protein
LHHHTQADVIAIKMKCCATYYACKDCHIALAGHAIEVWPRSEWNQQAILCGACGAKLTISEYMQCESRCPICSAPFNPGCRNHHHFYFTHICVKKRSNGMYTVLRQTIRKRLQMKLNEVKAELQRRMHEPIPELGKWLQAVVRGHARYYGVPMNQPALFLFRFQVGRLWYRALSRRSQNGRILWDRMRRLITRWLPLPTVCHPYPLRRMGVLT